MTHLWALAAIRLIMPVRIEAGIGFIPDFGSSIHSFFYGSEDDMNADSATYHDYQEETTHTYTASGLSTETPQVDERDYLPNEGITVIDIGPDSTYASSGHREVLIRLQMVWLFGIVLVIGYAIFSYVYIKKKTAASVVADDSDNVYECDEINTPFVLGIIKPAIYLPSGLDGETRENVLAHESMHIRRADHLWKLFGFLILALHWFNPFVWVSYILFCKDIELACDESVIRRMSPDEKKSYAKALFDLSTHQRTVAVYPLAFGETDVKTRVKRIVSYKKPALWVVIAAVAICGVALLGFLSVQAENPTDAQSQDTAADAQSEEPPEVSRHRQEAELEQMIRDYDKENLVNVSVLIMNEADGEIISAVNILGVSRDKMLDPDEQDKIRRLAADYLGISIANINLEFNVENAEDEVSIVENSSQDMELREPPVLSIVYDGKKTIATRGTYSWEYTDENGNGTGTEADSPHPLFMTDQMVRVDLMDGADKIRLLFSADPQTVKVRCWDSIYIEDESSYEANYREFAYDKTTGIVNIGRMESDSVFEIIGTWDNGTVHYCFYSGIEKAVNEAGEDKSDGEPADITTDDTNYLPALGLSMYIKNVTDTGCMLVFKQSEGNVTGELETGAQFEIQKMNLNGEWQNDIKTIVDWEDIAYIIKKNGETELKINWRYIHSPMEPGHFRIKKEVMVYRGPGDFDVYDIYAEFDAP